MQLTKALWTFLPDWAVWSDGTRGENWRSLKGYFCEWFWFLSSYIPHVSMHFEKGRRLNVGTLVSAEKVPESLDFCHHDLSARFVLNEYSSFSHVSPMLECLGWDSPKDRRSLLQASMFYKIYMGDVARPLFQLESTDHLITSYRKIQRISPGAYIFQRPFLRGLYSESLIYGMKFGFQNRLGWPYRRVLMGVPSSQLITNFSAKNQLTTIFLAYSLSHQNFFLVIQIQCRLRVTVFFFG